MLRVARRGQTWAGISGSRAGGRSDAFSLIELMIVVAIAAIVSSIAIPSVMQARMAANESAAISSLRTLCTAESHYRLRMSSYGTIADLLAAGSLDESWNDGRKSGYVFASNVTPDGSAWEATADPESPGATGGRFFFADHSGVIRFNQTVTAGAADTPIQ